MNLDVRLDLPTMTMLNLSDVSKQFKVNRSTIYRAVSSGRLSRRADGSFDLAEVIRCFGEPVTNKATSAEQQVNPDQTKVIELLQKELDRYREREERLMDQIDRMQTLLEMKSHPVADAASQQQSQATQCDNPETIENKAPETNTTSQATLPQQPPAAQSDIAHATKRPGLLGRLVRSILD